MLIDALPHEGYDPAAYAVRPVTPTRIVAEGDLVTTGDRSFEVLHLPGRTPGEIGLWEHRHGRVVRLRDLPVRIVHGGHDDSFGRGRLIELVDDYVARRGP